MRHAHNTMEIGSSAPSREIRPWSAWLVLCVTIAFALLLPTPTHADQISGRVYDPSGVVMKDRTFTAQRGRDSTITFRTDPSGNFSVYLDAGRYEVHPQNDSSMVGEIKSYNQPVDQDIHLSRSPG